MKTPTAVSGKALGLAVNRMDARALDVVETLVDAGHEAYIVGGGVRDLLLGAKPKDFDVATSAEPGEVRKCFRRARLIGRRFPIVHVLFGRDFVEVTTFRALESEARLMHETGRILHDSSYGTLAEDALRRDFTVNALYYDPAGRQVLDFCDGLADIEAHTIRLIGDPATRYREDPVRMLRALRFAAKLDFTLDPATEVPLAELSPLLADIPPARLFEEFAKLFLAGKAVKTYRLLVRHGLFAQLFPLTDEVRAADPEGSAARFIEAALADTDARIAAGDSVTSAFLFAAFLWPPLSRYASWLHREGMGEATAVQRALAVILSESTRRMSIPRRFSMPMREIIQLQTRFRYRHGKRAQTLAAHPRFRAAFDFLRLRVEAGDAPDEPLEFWRRVQQADGRERERLLASNPPGRGQSGQR
ncbi:MAG: polynucleotide adenylyltransferase PcnB [Gammaproteobacteria bacterium]